MELRFAKTKKGKMLFAIFAIMLIACIALPVTAWGVGLRFTDEGVSYDNMKNVTNPDVLKMVHRANGLSDAGRSILWAILTGLASIVNYFDNAVEYITDLNLYNFIKDYFDINSFTYSIVGAVVSVSIVFVSVLLIYNADKTRLTDFARGILTSCMMIIALPTLTSATSDLSLFNLKKAGVETARSITSNETVTDDGVIEKENLGTRTLSEYVYVTRDSILNNKRVSIRNASSLSTSSVGFGFDENNQFKSIYNVSDTSLYSPRAFCDLDINGVVSNSDISWYFDDIETTVPESIQYKYSELTYEKRLEIAGGWDLYQRWQSWKEGKHARSQMIPGTLEYEYYVQDNKEGGCHMIGPWYLFTEDDPDGNNRNSYEYSITCQIAGRAINKLRDLGVSLDWNEVNSIFDQFKSKTHLDEALVVLDNYTVDFNGKELTAMQVLNIANNEALADKEESMSANGTASIQDLITSKDYAEMDWDEQILAKLDNWFTVPEHVYRYDFDFWWALLILVILAIALLFAGLKLAGLLYDILFAQIVVPIIVASDMNSSGKAKAAIQNLINTFLVFIIVTILLRLYILVLASIQDTTMFSGNFLAKVIIILAGAKFVIDGPDLVTKILGIDAGVKSGAATLMGVRSAVQMGTSAIRTAKTAAGKVNSFGGAVGGMTAGTISGIKNGSGVAGKTGSAFLGGISGASTGSKAGGLIGGAGAGSAAGAAIGNANGVKDKISSAFGNTASGQAFKSKANEQTRTNETYSSSSIKQGVSGDSNSNASISSSDSTPSSGGSDSSSHTSSHTSSDSSAPVVGGAFASVPVKGEKGDKGDKGDRGNDGLQGLQGQRGETGEKGKDAERNNEQYQGNAFNNNSDWSAQTRASESTTPTYAEQARATEHSTPSFAEQSRASENNAPTFAERAYRSEQPSAPSSPSPVRPEPAPSTHSEPSVPNPQPAPKTSDDKGKK